MIRHQAPFISRETHPSQHGDARITFESVKENCGGRAEGSSEVPLRIHLISMCTIKIPCSLASGRTLDCPVPCAPIVPDCLVDCMAGVVQFMFDVVQNPCLMNEIQNKSASLSLSLHSADINEVIRNHGHPGNRELWC